MISFYSIASCGLAVSRILDSINIHPLTVRTMNPSRRDLEQVFENLSDEELLLRCESGTLTEEAQRIAENEAHRRGLDPVEPQPVAEKQEEAYYGDFVVVVRGLNMTQAHLYKSLLESAGVPAEVGDANLSRIYGFLFSANVKVPAAFVPEALKVFAAYRRGEFALDDNFDSDGS